MRTWTPDWQPYATKMDQTPMVVTIDMAAAEAAPMESHPELLLVRLQLQRPRPDGLRAADEMDALGSAEDRLVEPFEAAGAIYVGRYTAGGFVVHAFYAPKGLRPPPPDLAPYVPGFASKLEPDWGFYSQFLYPDRWNLQLIHNRKVLTTLAAQGDDHEAERVIDHYAWLPGEPAARAAAERLGERFTIVETRADEDGDWMIHFTSEHALSDEIMAEECAAILEVVEAEHDGSYDGWGCPVVTGE